jgi:two-component system, chemotaxis family, protein-glutamate methylesterase/glutaminase
MGLDRVCEPLPAGRETRPPESRLAVLLALAEPDRREVIERILRSVGDIALVGVAESGPDVVRLTEELSPSLVIMGVELPMLNGFAATKEIMIRSPTPVLIIGGRLEGLSSMANESAYRAGALSYLPDIPATDDIEAARAFLDVVDAVAHSKATRYWRIRQSWETDAQIQAVAIFVSNASVEAFAEILAVLPEDFAAPIVVLPYVGRGFTAGVVSWLARQCPLAVKVAEEGESLGRARVYVAPEDRHLEIVADREPRISLSPLPPVGIYRPSGTYLLSTLARVYGPMGLAIVMEGVREDLVSAMCAIWLEGGRIFAHASARPKWHQWPPEQILSSLADAVLSTNDLGKSLNRMVAASR